MLWCFGLSEADCTLIWFAAGLERLRIVQEIGKHAFWLRIKPCEMLARQRKTLAGFLRRSIGWSISRSVSRIVDFEPTRAYPRDSHEDEGEKGQEKES
jgi:hypothetical protein